VDAEPAARQAEVLDADDLAPPAAMDPQVEAMLRDPAPYPTASLPSCVADLVRAYCESTGLPEGPVALGLLCACTAAIGNGLRIRVSGEWFEACAVWGIVLAESGSMKSACMVLPSRVLHAVQDRERDLSPAAEEDEQPVVVITGQPTTEALAVWQERNRRGLGLIRDELAGWLSSLDAYRTARGMDRAFFLESYDGMRYQQLRKQSKSVWIPHHLLTLYGCAQPRLFGSMLTAGDVDSGLLPRFNVTSLPRRAWTPVRADRDQECALRQAEDRLVEVLARVRCLPLRDGMHPHDVRADPAAAQVLESFGAMQSQRGHVLPDGAEASMLNKSRGVAARLALVIAVLEHAGDGRPPEDVVAPVGEGHARRACELAGWMANENLRTYQVLGLRHSGNQRHRALQLMAEVFQRCGRRPFTSRDFQRQHHVSADVAAGLMAQCRPEWEEFAESQNPKGGRQRVLWRPRGWIEQV
jgi:hypothetical protein